MLENIKITLQTGFIVLIVLTLDVLNANAADQVQSTDIKKIMTQLSGKKFALVIGIDKYPTMPLEAAVNDANAVSKRLEELNFQVTTLLDHQATLKNIRRELGTKLSLTKPNDQVVIYFAGHGVTEKLHGNKIAGYILPITVNLKDLYSTAISMKELRDLTARIPARHILFAFDSCYSGLGLTRSVNRAGTKENLQRYLEILAGKRAVYMVTAGKANEVAREFRGHGLFTLHFLDGIAGAADRTPKDGIVQASELGRFLARKVSMETGNEQNPQHGLIEGDGDFLFPLMDDDPVRLRESVLARLNVQSNELSQRKSMQDEFKKQIQLLQKSEKIYRDEYDRKIGELDAQIHRKKQEVQKLARTMAAASKGAGTREQYNIMKFLNTGVEIDILKIFPNLEAAETYFSNALGYSGRKPFRLGRSERHVPRSITAKLSKENAYPTKVKSCTKTRSNKHWLQNQLTNGYQKKGYGYNLAPGYTDYVSIKTITPSVILSHLDQIQTPLKHDTTTYVHEILYKIGRISSNDKLLLYNQFSDRMISRYGKPTEKGQGIAVDNWKKGKRQWYQAMIWEDQYVSMVLSGKDSSIFIKVTNKNPIIHDVWKQAINICEAEQLVLLKKRIKEMADLERQKTMKAKKLEF